jgi:hypothetical protein
VNYPFPSLLIGKGSLKQKSSANGSGQPVVKCIDPSKQRHESPEFLLCQEPPSSNCCYQLMAARRGSALLTLNLESVVEPPGQQPNVFRIIEGMDRHMVISPPWRAHPAFVRDGTMARQCLLAQQGSARIMPTLVSPSVKPRQRKLRLHG